MKCEHCGQHDSKVLKTERPINEDYSARFPWGTLKRRRRRCRTCDRTYFTFEVHESAFRKMLSLMEQESKDRAAAAIAVMEAEESAKTKKTIPAPAPRRTLRTKPKAVPSGG